MTAHEARQNYKAALKEAADAIAQSKLKALGMRSWHDEIEKLLSDEDKTEVRAIWDTMRGESCWMDALLCWMKDESLYQECLRRGIPTANHASDLYIPVNATTTRLVAEHGKSVTTFVNQVEGGLWYDVAFAFDPFWEAKQKGNVPS